MDSTVFKHKLNKYNLKKFYHSIYFLMFLHIDIKIYEYKKTAISIFYTKICRRPNFHFLLNIPLSSKYTNLVKSL